MLLSVSAFSLTASADPKIIYGDDNRVDVYASTNPEFVKLSKSTAAMISNSKMSKSILGLNFKLDPATLTQKMRACSDERFASQPAVARCSGFLISDKLLVTAGHCMRKPFLDPKTGKMVDDCKNNSWVFDYKMDSETEINLNKSASTVYKCNKIISRELNDQTLNDYALIELDRAVTDREPLKFRKRGKIKSGSEIVVIGHPSGLPTKITDDAQVKDLKKNYFTANLDTYGGNSGSAVFNVSTGEVEGILVRGDTDYKYRYRGMTLTAEDMYYLTSLMPVDPKEICMESNKVSHDKAGESVTYITNIKEIKNL